MVGSHHGGSACVCVCVCVCERERERECVRERVCVFSFLSGSVCHPGRFVCLSVGIILEGLSVCLWVSSGMCVCVCVRERERE